MRLSALFRTENLPLILRFRNVNRITLSLNFPNRAIDFLHFLQMPSTCYPSLRFSSMTRRGRRMKSLGAALQPMDVSGNTPSMLGSSSYYVKLERLPSAVRRIDLAYGLYSPFTEVIGADRNKQPRSSDLLVSRRHCSPRSSLYRLHYSKNTVKTSTAGAGVIYEAPHGKNVGEHDDILHHVVQLTP